MTTYPDYDAILEWNDVQYDIAPEYPVEISIPGITDINVVRQLIRDIRNGYYG